MWAVGRLLQDLGRVLQKKWAEFSNGPGSPGPGSPAGRVHLIPTSPGNMSYSCIQISWNFRNHSLCRIFNLNMKFCMFTQQRILSIFVCLFFFTSLIDWLPLSWTRRTFIWNDNSIFCSSHIVKLYSRIWVLANYDFGGLFHGIRGQSCCLCHNALIVNLCDCSVQSTNTFQKLFLYRNIYVRT